jgi:hypothetical protein
LKYVFIVVLACSVVGNASGSEIDTPHFRFESDAGAKATLEKVMAIAEQKRQEIFAFFGIHNEELIEVHIVSDLRSREMQTRPEWVAGYAIPQERKIVLFAYGDEVFHATDIFTHELAHIALHTAVEGASVPTWFNEGLAMLFADENLVSRLETLMKAQAFGGLIPLNELDQAFRAPPPRVHLAYSEAMFFVRFLSRELGSHGLGQVLSLAKEGKPFATALHKVTHTPINELFERFSKTLDRRKAMLWVVLGSPFLWAGITVLFIVAFIVKRQRTRLKKKAWEIQDELDRIQKERYFP